MHFDSTCHILSQGCTISCWSSRGPVPTKGRLRAPNYHWCPFKIRVTVTARPRGIVEAMSDQHMYSSGPRNAQTSITTNHVCTYYELSAIASSACISRQPPQWSANQGCMSASFALRRLETSTVSSFATKSLASSLTLSHTGSSMSYSPLRSSNQRFAQSATMKGVMGHLQTAVDSDIGKMEPRVCS